MQGVQESQHLRGRVHAEGKIHQSFPHSLCFGHSCLLKLGWKLDYREQLVFGPKVSAKRVTKFIYHGRTTRATTRVSNALRRSHRYVIRKSHNRRSNSRGEGIGPFHGETGLSHLQWL